MTDFSGLYRQYAQDVYRFAYYLCGNRGDAQDITSETFVRVWTAPEEIRMATVKGYLFTIARNLFLQSLRRKSRHVALEENLRDPQPSPYKQAEQREAIASLAHDLQSLPEASRAALLMSAVEGMPQEEIARVLGISLSAVKVKIHRARFTLIGLRDLDSKTS
jgi:RNA polymerase sigma-70 factor (ECF subfamily)